jgi:HPt (histidine-containing phosphotransfer) domain-containing protein
MSEQPPVLDEQVLDALRDSVGGDDAFVADLVATYLAEGAEHMVEMEVAAAAGDAAAIVRPAHSMKSSSAALGAARMSSISRDIEFAGREGRAEGLAASVQEARAAWEATVAELRARRLAG